jgi:hypothetical protein
MVPSMTAQIMPGGTVSSPAQVAASVQAAKSKTSRISLDSAIGVTTSIPVAAPDNAAPKTIRLKRPTDLAAPGPVTGAQSPFIPPTVKSASSTAAIKSLTSPIRQTSRIPDSAIPSEAQVIPASVDTSTVTQKKTLKIRRPGAPNALAASTESAGGDAGSVDGIQMTPISEIEAYGAPVSQGYKTFSVVSIVFASVAAILMVVLNWCLAADAIAPLADKNTAASIPVNMDVSWPGKFVQ